MKLLAELEDRAGNGLELHQLLSTPHLQDGRVLQKLDEIAIQRAYCNRLPGLPRCEFCAAQV
jgi:hypothetical protein